ncbi:MAG: hypothetical protein IPG56_08680 [Caulobacteraceae bacterium]|nr:hypothetical protein [Caulobacteraceae bacterium]
MSKPPPLCKLSGTIEPGRKVMLKLDQAPGAVLATFGDRTDSALVDGPYKHAGPFTHGIIEAFGNITNGKLPDDLVGEFPAIRRQRDDASLTALSPRTISKGMIARSSRRHASRHSRLAGACPALRSAGLPRPVRRHGE